MNLSLGIVLDSYSIALLFAGGDIWNQIEHELIIDLEIGYSDRVFVIETTANLLENMADRSRNESSVLVVLHAAAHGESFASSSLTIDHDCAVEPIDHGIDNISWARIEDVFLAGVMKDLVELESPRFLLIINVTAMLVLRYVHIYMLYRQLLMILDCLHLMFSQSWGSWKRS